VAFEASVAAAEAVVAQVAADLCYLLAFDSIIMKNYTF
jgi:hypothetical protein